MPTISPKQGLPMVVRRRATAAPADLSAAA
jgi:hypothetical protein